jgi:hypothetical protein
MAPKSRRKKKYVGQRSPQAVAAGVSRVVKPASRPVPAGAAPARPGSAGAVLAGVLLVALVVISVVLA